MAAVAALAFVSPAARAETLPEEPIRAPKAPVERDRQNLSRIERPVSIPQLEPASLDLKLGERLDYDIRVSGVPAGKAFMEVRKKQRAGDDEKGPEVWTVALEARSNRAVSMFMYNVQNMAKSLIDVKSGFSRFYSIDNKEGKSKIKERISFNYEIDKMQATYEAPRPTDGEWRKYMVPLPGKVLDPLAAVFYLRSMNLQNLKDESFFLPICTDRRVWNTKIKIVGRGLESVAGLKDRECLILEPEAEFKGLFERKGKMRIWVDSETGIPLKMNVEIPIGPAEVILTEQSNSPLQSK